MIRYFGYVDLKEDKTIRTCGLAEFDTSDLDQTDMLALENYEGDDDISGETLIESVTPTRIYFLIDNQDLAYNKRFVVDGDKVNYYTIWPIQLRDVFKTYKEAKQILYKEKYLIFRDLFK